jgi:hypothetical protein
MSGYYMQEYMISSNGFELGNQINDSLGIVKSVDFYNNKNNDGNVNHKMKNRIYNSRAISKFYRDKIFLISKNQFINRILQTIFKRNIIEKIFNHERPKYITMSERIVFIHNINYNMTKPEYKLGFSGVKEFLSISRENYIGVYRFRFFKSLTYGNIKAICDPSITQNEIYNIL